MHLVNTLNVLSMVQQMSTHCYCTSEIVSRYRKVYRVFFLFLNNQFVFRLIKLTFTSLNWQNILKKNKHERSSIVIDSSKLNF